MGKVSVYYIESRVAVSNLLGLVSTVQERHLNQNLETKYLILQGSSGSASKFAIQDHFY